MRISPGVPGLLPHVVQPGGLSISGHYFPAGTDMGVPHYVMRHNEAYYLASFAYKPERLLVDSEKSVSAESFRLAQSAFCPFSIGPCGCTGRSLAMEEIMAVVARLVYLYEMRISEGLTVGGGGHGLGEGR